MLDIFEILQDYLDQNVDMGEHPINCVRGITLLPSIYIYI